MVSATQQSSRIRRRKARTCGTRRKRFERAHGTPAFAVHPAGYSATAADAKVAAKAEVTPVAKADAKPAAHAAATPASPASNAGPTAKATSKKTADKK